MTPLPRLTVAIGYDPHEVIAWHVLAHSIQRRASRPVHIIPVMLSQLKGIYTRPRNPTQSTEFSMSRFLTPWLAEDNSVSIFVDCDFLCLCDIWELYDIAKEDMYQDVFVVKHDYTPNPSNKFLNQPQTVYPMKNWSSMMVFNGHRYPVKELTPEYVNNAEPMDLHQFTWASSVGSLPTEYNHLVGEYSPNPHAKLIHYTRGGPWFKGYEHVEFAKEWFDEFESMCHCETYSMFRQKGTNNA